MVETTRGLLTLRAADIMSRHVVMVPREMSLQGAARMLARAGVSGAPVVDASGRCIGVLSTTDFMNWVKDGHVTHVAVPCGDLPWEPWQMSEGPAEMSGCVQHAMTKDPVLATPEITLGELARMMMDAHIHRIIVVERVSRRPIGIVSSMDILAAVARADQSQLTESSPAAAGDTVH